MINFFNRKTKGYAITFEVIFTIILLIMMINFILYCLVTFDIQRYMTTVFTSTIIEIAKWGGINNTATNINGIGNIINTAQQQLDLVAYKFKPKISGGPDNIISATQKVWCRLEWTYPGFDILLGIKADPIEKRGANGIYIEMDPIMRPGGLLQ